LQHGVIGLPGSIFNGGKNIFSFKKRIVSKDFFKRGTGGEQFKNIRNTDTESPNARAPSTFALFYGNALKSLHIHSIAF